MTDYPHLKNAPAVEAILDLRVAMDDDFDESKLKAAHKQIKNKLPNCSEQYFIQKSFSIGDNTIDHEDINKLCGYRYASDDKLNVAQFRIDGFTYSRLKPYTSWADISNEAYQLMEKYIAIRNPTEISRIAVRYINQFVVNEPIERTGEYLTMPIALPPNLVKHEAQNFVSRISTQDQKTGTKSHILQSVDKTIGKPGFQTVLDIDVFKTGNFSPSTESVRPVFEEIRNIKNDVFFGSICENKWEIFQ